MNISSKETSKAGALPNRFSSKETSKAGALPNRFRSKENSRAKSPCQIIKKDRENGYG